MKIEKITIIFAILVMPLIISCSDGGNAFDISSDENLNPDDAEYTYTQEHITDLTCGLYNECPEELSCWTLDGIEGSYCVDPYPDEWYCAEGSEAIVGSSYPPVLSCQETDNPADDPTDEPIGPAVLELCDAETECSDGLECWSLLGNDVDGAQCVQPDPEEWYCPEGSNWTVMTSYPPVLDCSGGVPTAPDLPNEEAIEFITDDTCDLSTPCPAGTACWELPELGSICVTGNPMNWYCGEGTTAVKFLGDIPRISCLTVISD